MTAQLPAIKLISTVNGKGVPDISLMLKGQEERRGKTGPDGLVVWSGADIPPGNYEVVLGPEDVARPQQPQQSPAQGSPAPDGRKRQRDSNDPDDAARGKRAKPNSPQYQLMSPQGGRPTISVPSPSPIEYQVCPLSWVKVEVLLKQANGQTKPVVGAELTAKWPFQGPAKTFTTNDQGQILIDQFPAEKGLATSCGLQSLALKLSEVFEVVDCTPSP